MDETTCPTCNGHGYQCGDRAVRGERVDDVRVCPECAGAGEVACACWFCGAGADLTRDDARRRWECAACTDRPVPLHRMPRCEFCAASLPAGGELCEPCEADHAEAVAQDRRDPDRERAAWMRRHVAARRGTVRL